MTLKPNRKLKLNSETLVTLKSTTLDRVRGGIDVPDFDRGANTERCPASQSGPATCAVPDRRPDFGGGRGDTERCPASQSGPATCAVPDRGKNWF